MTSALIQPQIWVMYKTFLQQFPKPSVSFLASNCNVLAKKDMLHVTHLRKWVLESFIPVIAWSCIQHKPPARGDRNTTNPAATCLCLPTQSFEADLQNPISVPHLLFLPPFREQLSVKQWGTSQLSPALGDSWPLCKVGVPWGLAASVASWQHTGKHGQDSRGSRGSSPSQAGLIKQVLSGVPLARLTWRCSVFVASKYFCQDLRYLMCTWFLLVRNGLGSMKRLTLVNLFIG